MPIYFYLFIYLYVTVILEMRVRTHYIYIYIIYIQSFIEIGKDTHVKLVLTGILHPEGCAIMYSIREIYC